MTYEIKETLLRVENVSKNYDVPIIGNVSFEIKNITRPEVHQGQIVSLIGKSGSGKSTLFRIMAGLEKPTSGKVTIKNMETHDYEDVREGDMGVVFQNSYIFPWKRVDSIFKDAIAKNPKIKDKKEAIQHYVDIFSLNEHLKKYSKNLSGGQRQRVAIVEQILNGGDFILLDEPFSGLDTLTIDKVTEALVKVALEDEHKTLVIVSHDLSNSLAISDTAFILSKPPQADAATITAHISLADNGLAWQPDIKENPLFRDLLKQVKSLL